MIWVIGGQGMLGCDLSRVFKKQGKEFISSDKEVDITSLETIRDFASKIIHYG